MERGEKIVHITMIAMYVFLLTACKGSGEGVVTDRPPNLILIMADDLGYETLEVNGSTVYSTPNLNALAAGGMRFTQAYATPLCTPSRVQLMTGRYNFRNYIGFGLLDPEEVTFAHLLKEAGYSTSIYGKWQLYGNPRQREMFGRSGALPDEAGFDEHVLWQVKTRPGSRFKDPYLDIMGADPQKIEGAFGPDVFADSLIGFISRHRNEPFLAYYPMVLTHDPFQPTPDHPDYAGFDPESQQLNDPAYFGANVAYMDKIVGRIIQALDDEGLREHTLVLFIGDNGTDRDVTSPYGDEQIRGNKGYPTKYGTHVPMIANWPGRITPGSINDHLIDFTDFLPTLMDAAGTALPEGRIFDGLSFYDQLIGRADSVRSWIFCHYAPQWGNFQHRRYVQNETWKLYGDGSLFNVVDDPEELHPIDATSLADEEQALIHRFEAVLEEMQ